MLSPKIVVEFVVESEMVVGDFVEFGDWLVLVGCSEFAFD